MSEKGQVTIPKRLRERMGIAPGDLLEFREEDGDGSSPPKASAGAGSATCLASWNWKAASTR